MGQGLKFKGVCDLPECSRSCVCESEPEEILRSCHVCQLGGCSSLGFSIHKSRRR